MAEMGYSAVELMVVTFSRDLKNGEIGMCGAFSEIPQAAIRLAQLTHAPDLVCIRGASGIYNSKTPPLHYIGEYRNLDGAEGVVPIDTLLDLVLARMDFFFLGGFQIDKYGNLNMACVGDYYRPQMRGPGGAGLAISADFFRRYYIYLLAHRKYNFVDKVDFISGVGYLNGFNTRTEAGVPEGGPKLVVTPLSVMDFEPESKWMRLKSLHPGATLEQVIENTGFDLIIPSQVPETEPPTEEELRILRTEVDPQGVLQQVMGR